MTEPNTQAETRLPVTVPPVGDAHGEAARPNIAMTARAVRIAQPEDKEGLAVLLRLMHAENGIFAANEDKVVAFMHRAWAKDNAIIGVIGDPDALVACICLEVGSLHYSDDPVISDRFTFVHPDHRGHGCAKALIEFAKTGSDNLGLPLMLGVVSPRDVARKTELYRSMLGDPVGAIFFYQKAKPKPETATEGAA